MLEVYKKKRSLSKSEEPKARKSVRGKNSFVVQEHKATTRHWDFRIEDNGVMPSWAVTKKPNDTDKRLAIQTEDHPLEYRKFSGIIPPGNYGAGTVKIWDSGKYKNLRTISISSSIKEGKVEIELRGRKLNGSYAMIRMKPNLRYPGKDNWLFFKMKK